MPKRKYIKKKKASSDESDDSYTPPVAKGRKKNFQPVRRGTNLRPPRKAVYVSSPDSNAPLEESHVTIIVEPRKISPEIPVQNTEYKVAKVVNKRFIEDRVEYLLEWENWPLNNCSWEPISNLNCKKLIAQYEKREREKFDNPNYVLAPESAVVSFDSVTDGNGALEFAVKFVDGRTLFFPAYFVMRRFPMKFIEYMKANEHLLPKPVVREEAKEHVHKGQVDRHKAGESVKPGHVAIKKPDDHTITLKVNCEKSKKQKSAKDSRRDLPKEHVKYDDKKANESAQPTRDCEKSTEKKPTRQFVRDEAFDRFLDELPDYEDANEHAILRELDIRKADGHTTSKLDVGKAKEEKTTGKVGLDVVHEHAQPSDKKAAECALSRLLDTRKPTNDTSPRKAGARESKEEKPTGKIRRYEECDRFLDNLPDYEDANKPASVKELDTQRPDDDITPHQFDNRKSKEQKETGVVRVAAFNTFLAELSDYEDANEHFESKQLENRKSDHNITPREAEVGKSKKEISVGEVIRHKAIDRFFEHQSDDGDHDECVLPGQHETQKSDCHTTAQEKFSKKEKPTRRIDSTQPIKQLFGRQSDEKKSDVRVTPAQTDVQEPYIHAKSRGVDDIKSEKQKPTGEVGRDQPMKQLSVGQSGDNKSDEPGSHAQTDVQKSHIHAISGRVDERKTKERKPIGEVGRDEPMKQLSGGQSGDKKLDEHVSSAHSDIQKSVIHTDSGNLDSGKLEKRELTQRIDRAQPMKQFLGGQSDDKDSDERFSPTHYDIQRTVVLAKRGELDCGKPNEGETSVGIASAQPMKQLLGGQFDKKGSDDCVSPAYTNIQNTVIHTESGNLDCRKSKERELSIGIDRDQPMEQLSGGQFDDEKSDDRVSPTHTDIHKSVLHTESGNLDCGKTKEPELSKGIDRDQPMKQFLGEQSGEKESDDRVSSTHTDIHKSVIHTESGNLDSRKSKERELSIGIDRDQPMKQFLGEQSGEKESDDRVSSTHTNMQKSVIHNESGNLDCRKSKERELSIGIDRDQPIKQLSGGQSVKKESDERVSPAHTNIHKSVIHTESGNLDCRKSKKRELSIGLDRTQAMKQLSGGQSDKKNTDERVSSAHTNMQKSVIHNESGNLDCRKSKERELSIGIDRDQPIKQFLGEQSGEKKTDDRVSSTHTDIHKSVIHTESGNLDCRKSKKRELSIGLDRTQAMKQLSGGQSDKKNTDERVSSAHTNMQKSVIHNESGNLDCRKSKERELSIGIDRDQPIEQFLGEQSGEKESDDRVSSTHTDIHKSVIHTESGNLDCGKSEERELFIGLDRVQPMKQLFGKQSDEKESDDRVSSTHTDVHKSVIHTESGNLDCGKTKEPELSKGIDRDQPIKQFFGEQSGEKKSDDCVSPTHTDIHKSGIHTDSGNIDWGKTKEPEPSKGIDRDQPMRQLSGGQSDEKESDERVSPAHTNIQNTVIHTESGNLDCGKSEERELSIAIDRVQPMKQLFGEQSDEKESDERVSPAHTNIQNTVIHTESGNLDCGKSEERELSIAIDRVQPMKQLFGEQSDEKESDDRVSPTHTDIHKSVIHTESGNLDCGKTKEPELSEGIDRVQPMKQLFSEQSDEKESDDCVSPTHTDIHKSVIHTESGNLDCGKSEERELSEGIDRVQPMKQLFSEQSDEKESDERVSPAHTNIQNTVIHTESGNLDCGKSEERELSEGIDRVQPMKQLFSEQSDEKESDERVSPAHTNIQNTVIPTESGNLDCGKSEERELSEGIDRVQPMKQLFSEQSDEKESDERVSPAHTNIQNTVIHTESGNLDCGKSEERELSEGIDRVQPMKQLFSEQSDEKESDERVSPAHTNIQNTVIHTESGNLDCGNSKERETTVGIDRAQPMKQILDEQSDENGSDDCVSPAHTDTQKPHIHTESGNLDCGKSEERELSIGIDHVQPMKQLFGGQSDEKDTDERVSPAHTNIQNTVIHTESGNLDCGNSKERETTVGIDHVQPMKQLFGGQSDEKDTDERVSPAHTDIQKSVIHTESGNLDCGKSEERELFIGLDRVQPMKQLFGKQSDEKASDERVSTAHLDIQKTVIHTESRGVVEGESKEREISIGFDRAQPMKQFLDEQSDEKESDERVSSAHTNIQKSVIHTDSGNLDCGKTKEPELSKGIDHVQPKKQLLGGQSDEKDTDERVSPAHTNIQKSVLHTESKGVDEGESKERELSIGFDRAQPMEQLSGGQSDEKDTDERVSPAHTNIQKSVLHTESKGVDEGESKERELSIGFDRAQPMKQLSGGQSEEKDTDERVSPAHTNIQKSVLHTESKGVDEGESKERELSIGFDRAQPMKQLSGGQSDDEKSDETVSCAESDCEKTDIHATSGNGDDGKLEEPKSTGKVSSDTAMNYTPGEQSDEQRAACIACVEGEPDEEDTLTEAVEIVQENHSLLPSLSRRA